MKTILVVDDMAVFRQPIAASLQLAGYQTLCAIDGFQALEVTRQSHPDVILLDAVMPRMDGITFLRHLRADPSIAKTHVILLTALTDKKSILAAGSCGVRDYLLKSRFNLRELLARIEKTDEPQPLSTTPPAASQPGPPPDAPAPQEQSSSDISQIPRILTREQFLQKIEGVLQVKTLSGVVAQVIALANSPRGDMQQLATLIARDAMLSARVLQAANSAAYATVGNVVATIPDAIRKVGFGTVRNIAAAIGVFDCLPEPDSDGFSPICYWQHSFAVAQLCERFASMNIPDQAGQAYIVGLCHDLGQILLHSYFAAEYQQVLETIQRTGLPIEKIYSHMLGMTEMQMCSAVLKFLGIPDVIREPIEQFSSVNARSDHPLARILYMAENYANAAMLASSAHSRIAPVSKAFCKAVTGHTDPECPDAQQLRAEVLSLTVSLAKLSRSEEAKLTAPMFQANRLPIWLARERSLSQFDPLATALKSLVELQISDRLPAGSELESLRGIIITAPDSTVIGFTQTDIETALGKPGAPNAVPFLAIASDLPDPQSPPALWNPSLSLAQLGAFLEALPSTGRSLSLPSGA